MAPPPSGQGLDLVAGEAAVLQLDPLALQGAGHLRRRGPLGQLEVHHLEQVVLDLLVERRGLVLEAPLLEPLPDLLLQDLGAL